MNAEADDMAGNGAPELDGLRQKVVRMVRRLKPGVHDVRLKVAGTRVDARLKVVESSQTLIANFHGAYSGGARKPPLFGGFFKEIPEAHQISMADPSILARPGSRIAWYAGHEGFDTQAVLLEVLRGVIIGLAAPRMVMVGASGGGFAALYFGHCLERSITVAINPQTCILAYSPRLVEEYRRTCWPSLDDNAQLEQVTRTSLVDLYGAGFRNSVIYVQSMGDRTHSHIHMMPFAGAAGATEGGRNLLLHSDFNGEIGHVFSRELLTDWVRAAVASPTRTAADLLATWHRLRQGSTGIPQPPLVTEASQGPGGAGSHGFSAGDLALAERLRNWREPSQG